MIKTKIIATIGPASNSKLMLKKLIQAGMNVARLNFSHGTHEQHLEVIKTIRTLSFEMDRAIGILLDLQGPKIRTGELENHEPVLLKNNSVIGITTQRIPGNSKLISTTYQALPDDVCPGDKVLIDDGLIELKVLEKSDHTVTCKVVNGGVLKEKKGINLPGVDVSAPSLTEKDKKDLEFAIREKVDYIALSFVRQAEDLTLIKRIIHENGADIPVIAKIEKPEAIKNLSAIIKEADAIMVARGDLGVELKPQLVPTKQKQIIHQTVLANKTVITATQMLESMAHNPIPTRAEASDVANAVYDGTSAIMLSGETASGKFPVEAVSMMATIAREAEYSPFSKYNIQFQRDKENLVSHAIAQSAVNIQTEINAKAIVVFTLSGKTAILVAKQRPKGHVFAFTPSAKIYQRLTLAWGITPVMMPAIESEKLMYECAEDILLQKKYLAKNDVVVIITGQVNERGSTNSVKVHKIGYND